MCAELSFLDPTLAKAEEIYAVMKALDRTVISWNCYWEFLLLGHISLIFLNTTKAVGAVTSKKYKIMRYLIIGFLIVLFFVICVLTIILFVAGGLIAGYGNTPVMNNLILAVFLISAVTFFAMSISTLILLHMTGSILLKSLHQGHARAKALKNNAQLTNATLSETTQQTQDKIEKEVPQNLESKEQENSVNIKKQVLKKAWAILIVATVCLVIQFIGFFFIPLSMIDKNLMLVYFVSYDVTIVVIISLFIGIHRPLKEVQRVFRRNSMSSNGTTSKKQKLSNKVGTKVDESQDLHSIPISENVV